MERLPCFMGWVLFLHFCNTVPSKLCLDDYYIFFKKNLNPIILYVCSLYFTIATSNFRECRQDIFSLQTLLMCSPSLICL